MHRSSRQSGNVSSRYLLPPPSNPSKPTQPEKPLSPSPGSGVAGVRMPTAPWMTSPLIVPAGQILDLSKPRKKNPTTDDEESASLRFLNSGVRGGRSREAMLKIFKSVSGLRKINPPPPEADAPPEENYGVKETMPIDFSTPLDELDAISSANGIGVRRRKEPWAFAKEERLVYPRLNKKRILTKAEMVLPTVELERHREEAMEIRKWVRGKKAGLTPEVVKGINRAWRKNELAMVKLVNPLRLNMVRAPEIVEVASFLCV
ncbi:hypothetical protein KSP40_PGU012183 [Platanthera guangdongensis]|uniref:CRM domain-containing protein n=1 Tax=Platanthera guangdongensis TaxID=2320717 RepID=A0ABR2MDV5_9ASPA